MIRLIMFIILLWDAPTTGHPPDGYTVFWKPCNQAVYQFDVQGTRCRLPGVYPFTDYQVKSWKHGYDGKKYYSKPSNPLRWFHPLIKTKFNYSWGRQ